MIGAVQAVTANGAGLTKKSISVSGYQAHYYEGGDASNPTLVLLHGLNDDKNSFVTSIRGLASNYHIILPDLRAHGGNAKSDDYDHSIAGQVDFINQLTNTLGISTFVIGGNSMGGHTSVAYSARYPDKIRGLILLNATGMQIDNESVYEYFPEKVDVHFLNSFFKHSFVTPPAFPKPVLQHFVNQINSGIPFINGLIKQVETGVDFRMNEKAQSIEVPSLILWGKHDPIVPLEYAQLFDQNLPQSRLVVFDNAGHSPQFEIPVRVQNELNQFMQGLN